MLGRVVICALDGVEKLGYNSFSIGGNVFLTHRLGYEY